VNREPRTPISAQVKIMGLDARGQAYTEVAHTIDVSTHGMRIDKAGFLRKRGEVVTVFHGANRMRFRVVWIGQSGSSTEGQAALAPDVAAEDTGRLGLFQDATAAAQPPAAEPSSARPPGVDRRSVPRYLCDRGVQVWKQGDLVSVYGKLRDLSLGGCYVETAQALPVQTQVRLAMSLFGMNVRAVGVVRASTDGKGMGIEFTSVRPEDVSRLHAVVGRLSKKQA